MTDTATNSNSRWAHHWQKATERIAAWELIQPEEDWRGPIDKWIHSSILPDAQEACMRYTATELQVVDQSVGGTLVRVQAVGYRMGPAGP